MTNTITVKGVIGSDPELRYTKDGTAVTSFRVADSTNALNQETKQWEQVGETIWWNVSTWNEKAEAAANQLKKGERVVIEGKISFRSYTTKDGTQAESKELRVTEISKPLAGKGKTGNTTGGYNGNVTPQPNVTTSEDTPF